MSPRRFAERLARQAARVALAHARRPGQSSVRVTRKEDHTIVTRADRAIERIFVREIREAFPDHGILGEEGARRGGSGRHLWALDPIDGTSAYSRGIPLYTISIALLEDGVPRMGVVHFPALRETYSAERGEGACEGARRLRKIPSPLPFGVETLLLLPSNAHRRYLIELAGKGRSLGSTAGHIAYVARGTAEAALCRGSLWDIAAAAVSLEEAGGALSYLSGRAIDWSELASGRIAPEAILAAHPAALPELRWRIARKPV
ncbi:MAG: inositol monophosphatase [Acidobacteriota bacterium]